MAPFDDAILRNLIAWQIESGNRFLVPLRQTGETPNISTTHDEWLHA